MTTEYDIIACARTLCVEIAGPADESDDDEVYGSIDIARILSSEVIRLRQQLADVFHGNSQATLRAEQLEADNAALRELLRKWAISRHVGKCYLCETMWLPPEAPDIHATTCPLFRE